MDITPKPVAKSENMRAFTVTIYGIRNQSWPGDEFKFGGRHNWRYFSHIGIGEAFVQAIPMVRQRARSSRCSNTCRAQTDRPSPEGNQGSSNMQQPPTTSNEWACHIKWFDVKGCSLGYGPMPVSPPQPPAGSPPGENLASESSMGHDGSSSVSEESKHS